MSLADVRASEGTRRHIKRGRFMPPRQRRGSPEGRSAAHYCGSSEEFPVPAKNSLYSERTGNRLQAIELTWRAALKTARESWRNSLLFPCSQGMRGGRIEPTSRSDRPRSLTPSSPAMPHRHRPPTSGNATPRRARLGRSPRTRYGSPPQSPQRRPDASAWRRAA
jgi:hypothetical protein